MISRKLARINGVISSQPTSIRILSMMIKNVGIYIIATIFFFLVEKRENLKSEELTAKIRTPIERKVDFNISLDTVNFIGCFFPDKGKKKIAFTFPFIG